MSVREDKRRAAVLRRIRKASEDANRVVAKAVQGERSGNPLGEGRRRSPVDHYRFKSEGVY